MPRISNVTPCVLVKNEEFFLPYCLESVSGRFENYVIYDVGSTDRTKDILEWWIEKELRLEGNVTYRFLPDCPPNVQGTFRNSMIAEANNNCYMILDGDEVYHENEIPHIEECATTLLEQHNINIKKRYGLFRRLEFSPDMRLKYETEREHHRLYHRSAFWTGNHPGEAAYYRQNEKSEVDYKKWVRVFHFHNALRSSKEAETWKRLIRKTQKSYHPGQLQQYNLLKELPILRNPIHDWDCSDALKILQAEYHAS